MKSPPFQYQAPKRLDEALNLLQTYGSDAKILAGGQSLMPMMNMRLARPAVIVDINGISALDALHTTDGELAVGALVRHNDLLRLPEVRAGWPLLTEATEHVGHQAIRNRGTVCGSIAHADPSAEQPAVLAALNGQVVVAGPRGERRIGADQFFLAPLTTALEPDEMVVGTIFPRMVPGTGTCFLELARRAGDFALVGVAVALTLANGICVDARVALTGIGGVPYRARSVEVMLTCRSMGNGEAPTLFAEAARQVRANVDPDEDVHATADYRSRVAGVLTRRALLTAFHRAGGKTHD